MAYRKNSLWNDNNEIKCFLIFKMLDKEGFPRGKQNQYCFEMSKVSNLTSGSISAKICNYKSVAGINNSSNASKNTIRIYNKYKNLSIDELEKIVE